MPEDGIFFGRWRLLPRTRTLVAGGERIVIGGRAVEILLCLIEAGGEVVARDTLIARAWPGRVVEEANLAVQISALQLRPADPDRPARTLSGGNQQKILLARWLVNRTSVLLLDEPTRGVDVGARAEIYALIRKLAANGDAIVIVSSEIEEVLGLADTVLVIADGRVLSTVKADQIDEHRVLDLIMEGTAA